MLSCSLLYTFLKTLINLQNRSQDCILNQRSYQSFTLSYSYLSLTTQNQPTNPLKLNEIFQNDLSTADQRRPIKTLHERDSIPLLNSIDGGVNRSDPGNQCSIMNNEFLYMYVLISGWRRCVEGLNYINVEFEDALFMMERILMMKNHLYFISDEGLENMYSLISY